MEDFTPADAGAVATASGDAKDEAERRRERMPTSAAVFDRRAEVLLVVLSKILDRLPERFHEHRALVYPEYRAVIVLAFGVTTLRPTHTLAQGKTYVVLLYEDSTYRPAPAGHDAERVAVLARWADSLNTFGKFERAARLSGSGPLGGLFIIRAADDADVARIAASCPFTKWGGHIEVKRVEQ